MPHPINQRPDEQDHQQLHVGEGGEGFAVQGAVEVAFGKVEKEYRARGGGSDEEGGGGWSCVAREAEVVAIAARATRKAPMVVVAMHSRLSLAT